MEYTSCMCRCTKSVPQVSCADCSVISTGCDPRSILLLGLSSTLPVALFQACRGWIFFLDCQIIMLLVCDSLMLLRCGAYVSIPIASCLWDGVNLIDEMLNDLLWLIRIRIYMYLCCVSWQLCKRKLHTVQNLRISLLLAWLYISLRPTPTCFPCRHSHRIGTLPYRNYLTRDRGS